MSTSEQKKEERRAKTVGLVRIFTNTQTIIYLILTYNFSDLNPISCFIFLFHLAISSVNQEDEFTEVARKRTKRKAISSPTLPILQKTSSSEQPPETPVRPKTSTLANKIPVILSGIDKQFETWRSVMGELRQYHPSLKVSQVKELPKDDLLVIGDSVQDVVILQNENKMKAALGQNAKITLPKAYQINRSQNKSLAIKGVPTDITDDEFREFLNLNKISYAMADRLKSKKDGRVLPIFQLETNDPDEAEALLSQNLTCNVTGIVYKVNEFRKPVSVTQCFNCQSFGHSAKNCRSKPTCLICGESHSHKGCPNKEARNQSVQIVWGHMLHLIKGVQSIKSRHLGSMW